MIASEMGREVLEVNMEVSELEMKEMGGQSHKTGADGTLRTPNGPEVTGDRA